MNKHETKVTFTVKHLTWRRLVEPLGRNRPFLCLLLDGGGAIFRGGVLLLLVVDDVGLREPDHLKETHRNRRIVRDVHRFLART